MIVFLLYPSVPFRHPITLSSKTHCQYNETVHQRNKLQSLLYSRLLLRRNRFNAISPTNWAPKSSPAILAYSLGGSSSVLCRMKMLPVMISAKYHSSARSAVSESPNSSARLVSQCPNSSARLVSQCPNSSARLVFPMFQVELATLF